MGGFPIGTEPADIGSLLSRLAWRADEAGFDSLWTMDHFFQIPITGQPPEAPLLEAYAVLAFLTAETERIRLGTMVTSVAYRHPGALIKAVTSIDVLSGGRVIFGVGAGAPFNELPPGRSPGDFETYGLGLPFPPLAERFERLEEVVQIALQMWRGDETLQGEDLQGVGLARGERPHPLDRARRPVPPPAQWRAGGRRRGGRFLPGGDRRDRCRAMPVPWCRLALGTSAPQGSRRSRYG